MTADEIASLFPPGVVAAVAGSEAYEAPLFAAEREFVAAAVEGRRRDFAAGRACARIALGRLGVDAGPILVGPTRAPIWPSGYVGSITHCRGFCAAVCAPASAFAAIGLDAEVASRLTRGVERRICLADELQHFEDLPALVGAHWPILAFSAKEAFYKAYATLCAQRLDFLDVVAGFQPGTSASCGRFSITLRDPAKAPRPGLAAFGGAWRIGEGRVHAALAIPL